MAKEFSREELIEKLRARTIHTLPSNWKDGRTCPECGALADRQKCMWDMGPSCPRHDPTAYCPSPYVDEPDAICVMAADLLEKDGG